MKHTVERSSPVAGAPVLQALPAVGRPELRLAGKAVVALAVLAVPVSLVAGALEGLPGVIGALAGLALVAVLFGAAGAAQGLAARRSASTVLTVMALGFVVRLALYLALLQALGQVAALHRTSLAIATAVGFVVTLHYELRLISKTPELFWVELGDSRRRTAHVSAARRA